MLSSCVVVGVVVVAVGHQSAQTRVATRDASAGVLKDASRGAGIAAQKQGGVGHDHFRFVELDTITYLL